MKKLTAFVFVLMLFVCCFTVNSYAVDCSESTYSNKGDHEYDYNWADVINSYLVDCGNNTLMRFQYDNTDSTMFAEYYTYDYKLINFVKIKAELPIFGGFHASDNHYFVLTGQKNPEESAETECFRITKYDKEWNRITSVGLYDCNTTYPFDAGSARFAECGDYLIIRTAHEMYKSSDGYNHQANVTIEMNMKTMQITDSFTDIMNSFYGYVSHSFNQFVEVENNSIVAVDHGDAYPRSICLIKYSTDASDGTFVIDPWGDGCSVTHMLPIYGKTGANYTGCTVGGFEISPSAYLVVGSSVDQTKEHSYKDISNIFVSSLSKTTGEVDLKYITDYSDASAGTPYLVRISADEYLLMWGKENTVYYTKLDATGKSDGKIYTMNASLSDCEPIVVNGKIVWYVSEERNVDFYSINTGNLYETKKTSVFRGHDYKVGSVKDNSVSLSCKKCGDKKTDYIPTDYALYAVTFFEDDYNMYPISNQQIFHPGEELILKGHVYYNEGENLLDTKLTASDPSVVKIEEFYYWGSLFYKVKFLKEGSVELTYSSAYTTKYGVKYSLTVRYPTIRLSKTSYTYNGKVQKPSVTVTDSNGNVMKYGTDYKVTYAKGRTLPGKYAVKVDFIGNYSGSKTLYYNIVLPAPTGVKTTQSANAIRLTWNKLAGADGYRVYAYSAKNKKYIKLATITATNYTAKNLKPGATYQFKVIAYKMINGTAVWGNYTPVVTATTKPAVPTGIKTAHNINAIKIAWKKTAGADGYRIYQYDAKTKKYTKLATITATSYLVKNLKFNVTYNFKIVAYKKVGNTVVWGDYSSAIMAKTKLPAFTGIKIAQNTSAIKLSWNMVAGADGYRVYHYNAKTKKYTKLATITATSYMVKNLKAGTTYQFKLIAYKKVGNTVVWGDYTSIITASTRPVATKINAVASTAKGRAAVAWTDIAGETGYELYASTKKDTGYKKIVTTRADVTKGVKTNLVSGRTYYFKVISYKTVGNTKVYSGWSNIRALKIK